MKKLKSSGQNKNYTNRISMEKFQKSSYLSSTNATYIETLYENFLKDSGNVSREWFQYFQSLSKSSAVVQKSIVHNNKQKQTLFGFLEQQRTLVSGNEKSVYRQTAVSLLIEAFRKFGHLVAKINPLEKRQKEDRKVEPILMDPRLELDYYGLSEDDCKETFVVNGFLNGPYTLKEIYSRLREIYCGSIGMQFDAVSNEEERNWLQYYAEHRLCRVNFSESAKKNILQQLVAAEILEKYLDTRYVGQIRYSLEGGESLIPLLNELIKRSCSRELNEMAICMAHRGRINVLLNVMGKPASELFQVFEEKENQNLVSGDVKYHQGYSRNVKTDEGSIHLSLAFNPSHLEFICPVVMGSVRARQERQRKQNSDHAMAVMIHGDAAFSGEGVVMEVLNMSQTRAYYVGGSIHIVLNNQLGFTTENPKDARSSLYCTDVAKMLDAPVLHVNGDDPESVILVARLALDYRMTFHKDIFIDLVCYRRHGHQEVDDPTPTQPEMYKIIQNHNTVRVLYETELTKQKICTSQDVSAWIKRYRICLDEGKKIVETVSPSNFSDNWAIYLDKKPNTTVDTTISLKKLKEIGKKFVVLPNTFKPHRKVAAIYNLRFDMVEGKVPMDWGFGEMIAYASLLEAGHSVRLVGQDSRRGTFFHRHAILFDQETGAEYEPLKRLENKQAKAYFYDSLLCETGALAFEYGYSTTDPESLIVWEAQFGDFANVAQVIVDQFISAGWQKWNRLSNLVMFLPHGYEGKGPEHSSARLERYLQLCAQNNIQVCIPTTPAQIFHLLRRQVLSFYRRPLIIMTPKSLLRHKMAVSLLEDITHSQWKLIIPEIDKQDLKKIERVVLCSGKIYYDLLIKRQESKLRNIVLIRVEQLYPFPYKKLQEELGRYSNAKQVIWCQEEPKNQGAWFCIRHRLERCLRDDQILGYVGRASEASPATGYPSLHFRTQNILLNEALGIGA
ncbi:2-oxoglutarate dehydrogenase E1 component [Coxiella endosymbiont of Amblyomma sculptum]|uniref:2-oxoglutarate dehydrogenase E1 component n=1 Tax=Coxiella endosymbiont of Amblyomma sculptum TaxID=2487929 RepID=UPI00132E89CB|nr:2-oxoglutarate dehydrogenase E1 component [Coxiella endosymbiont of Amblyomma sculptum]QHG92329.1 2-oxoglutarate dehydrogenase E1 component [Coxiella endosymbiont of Amblyomma sculptum]